MRIDLEDFGIEEEEKEEQGEETEIETPELPKEEEEENDTCDRSVPLSERIDKEIGELKFTTGIMRDYEYASALQLAELIKDELKTVNGKLIEAKWDENKWSFPKLWEAVFDMAKKELKSKSCGVSDKVVMGWAQHIVVDTKPKKKEKAQPVPTATTAKPYPRKTEEPKKGTHEQLTLDLSDF